MLNTVQAARLLRGVLSVNGLLAMGALPFVFVPTEWMDAIHRQIGMGPLPQGPIVEYLTRTISGLYAVFGVMTLIVARDTRRYAPLVTWWGATAIVLSILFFVIDQCAAMPASWTWGEGLYLFLTGLVVLTAQRRAGE